MQQLRMHRRPELGIDDDGPWVLAGYVADGQLRIIHEHCPHADQDRSVHRSQPVRKNAGFAIGDTRTGTHVRGDAAIDALRVAQRNRGTRHRICFRIRPQDTIF